MKLSARDQCDQLQGHPMTRSLCTARVLEAIQACVVLASGSGMYVGLPDLCKALYFLVNQVTAITIIADEQPALKITVTFRTQETCPIQAAATTLHMHPDCGRFPANPCFVDNVAWQ